MNAFSSIRSIPHLNCHPLVQIHSLSLPPLSFTSQYFSMTLQMSLHSHSSQIMGEMVLCFLICPLFALRCPHSLRKCILSPLHLYLLLLCLLLSPPFHLLLLQSLLLFHLLMITLGLSTSGIPERSGCLSSGLSLNATNK